MFKRRVRENGAGAIATSEMTSIMAALDRSQAVIQFKPDGTILTANPGFLGAMGYALDEIKGQHHRMFVERAYADSPGYATFWESLRTGTFQSGEYKRLGKGGREVWIQATYNPIFDPSGKLLKVVKFATDVTARVAARAEAERVGQIVDGNLEKILSAIQTAGQQSMSAASASGDTLESVQSIASATEEMEASAREIAQSVTYSRTEVDKASREADAADTSTHELSEAASAMNSIVEIIQDIASQINLLALNATIESARAGEAGKGFAVVASEVKNLASQVAKATEQISGEIVRMQDVSGTVVERLGTIRGAISSVETSVTNVAGAIEQQSATTREIAGSMQAAARSVGDITQRLGGVTGAVDDADALAQEGTKVYRSLRREAV